MTIRSTIFTTAAAAIVLGAASMSPRPAEAAIESLGECYNAVISWCNETFPEHASECASSSGLDECDEVFGDNQAPGAYDRIKVLIGETRGDRLPELKLELVKMPRKPGGGDEDRDRGSEDRERGGNDRDTGAARR